MATLSQSVTIINQRGLHARASAKFVNMVAALPDGLLAQVEKDGTTVTGTSIMGLMMLGAAKGSDVTVLVTGPDEAEAERVLTKLVGLIKDGFGED